MDDPPAVGSAGFQRRERERAEAKREADAAAKAKAVLEKRLAEAQADLFKHAGSGAEAGKQHELDRLRGEISDQIKRDVEKAKREAEAEREFRKAEAVISHKLYEKEEAAKRRVVEAKRAARVERRLERQDDDFKETFAELNEAEAARAKRARQREEAKKDAASKEKEKEKRTLSAAEKEALRAEHIKAAAERAARAEAAKEAEKAARAEAAARRADGAAAGTSKPSRDENNKPVVLSRSRVPANAVEWKLRRSALEGLAQILGSETRCGGEARVAVDGELLHGAQVRLEVGHAVRQVREEARLEAVALVRAVQEHEQLRARLRGQVRVGRLVDRAVGQLHAAR